jgi:transcriptional regulator of acetoin/glycerol metabolism
VAINERAVISTPAAARALAPDQLAVLWEHVAEVVANRCSDRVELRATDDRAVVCDCSPLIEDGVVHGALVEFGPVAERRPAVSEAGGTGPTALRLGGASRGWRQIVREADRLARSPLPLLVAGPPGTGKLELVRAMHHQAIERERCAVLDAALSSVDVPDKWLTHLIDLLAGDDDVVVVRHLDQLDARMANVLSTVMDHRSGRTTNRVVATMTTEGSSCSPALAALLDRFAHRIDLPALGERRDEIPDIAHALVERHRPGSGRRFVGEALQVLMRANWPGNVRQLETAVLGALQWRDTGDVTVEDLPRHLVSRSTSGLTPIQQAELKAIVAALRASEGNKQEAAASLGIARSTLYRKLRQFGLDLDRLAY